MTLPAQTLGRRSVYLLPTREGLWFAGTVFVLLLAAVNYGNGLAYAVTFLLAALATVSALASQRNLMGLVVHEGLPRPDFAGRPVAFRVVLHNTGATARLGLSVTATHGPTIRVDLAPGEQRRVEIPWPTVRRGIVPAPSLRISSYYPLGLLRVWSRRIPLANPAIVYPRPAPFAPLPAGRSGRRADRDVAVAGADGGGDFADLAPFRVGESPRHIHWKAAAAGKGLLVKRFAGLSDREVWITGGDGVSEDDLQRMARQTLDAEKGGYRYGLALGPLRIPAGAGPAQRERVLTALALHGHAAS